MLKKIVLSVAAAIFFVFLIPKSVFAQTWTGSEAMGADYIVCNYKNMGCSTQNGVMTVSATIYDAQNKQIASKSTNIVASSVYSWWNYDINAQSTVYYGSGSIRIDFSDTDRATYDFSSLRLVVVDSYNPYAPNSGTIASLYSSPKSPRIDTNLPK